MNKEFNLLLKKQIVQQVKLTENLSCACLTTDSQKSFLQEECSSLLVSRKTIYPQTQALDKYEQIKLDLADLQLQESKELENHKTLIDTYNLLESVIEHVLNHMECVFLESKSSQRLSKCLNSYAVHENCLTEEISTYLKKLSEKMDFSAQGNSELKTKLLLSFGSNEKLQNMCGEFKEKHANYKLALKNFKIILEVLAINDDSLEKLKQQFHEVLMDYRHCRSILQQELPFAISERSNLLAETLNILTKKYCHLESRRNIFNDLLKEITRKLQHCQYSLVNRNTLNSVLDDGDSEL